MTEQLTPEQLSEIRKNHTSVSARDRILYPESYILKLISERDAARAELAGMWMEGYVLQEADGDYCDDLGYWVNDLNKASVFIPSGEKRIGLGRVPVRVCDRRVELMEGKG